MAHRKITKEQRQAQQSERLRNVERGENAPLEVVIAKKEKKYSKKGDVQSRRSRALALLTFKLASGYLSKEDRNRMIKEQTILQNRINGK